jgi:hypothetical protein
LGGTETVGGDGKPLAQFGMQQAMLSDELRHDR